MLWYAQTWLQVFLDASVKSLALTAVAMTTIWVLRIHNSHVQHRIWSFVLSGMLLLPLLTLVSPTIPLPAWMSWQPILAQHAHQSAHARRSDHGAALPVGSKHSQTQSKIPKETTRSASASDSGDVLRKNTSDSRPNAIPNEHDSTGPMFFIQQRLSTALRPTSWIAFVVVLHGSIMLTLLGRLALAVYLTRRLVHRAHPINSSEVSLILSDYRVYESTEVQVPVVVGVWLTSLTLPHTWRSWNASQLSAVAIHELEHIRRRDTLVTLLAELNRAIYWYHPVAWWLRRRLVQLAEQACDDAVISTTGDRFDYARYLLEFASALQANPSAHRMKRILSSGAAMARSSLVETRINAILNLHRPLSTRMSRRGSVLLAACGIALVLCTAAIQPPTSDGDDIERAPLAIEPTNEESQGRTYAGTVLLPDGTPAVGAKIYLVDWIATPLKQVPVSPVAITKNDGQFEFATSDFQESMSSTIVAQLNGYGFGWAFARALANPDEVKTTIATPTIQELMHRDRSPLRLTTDSHPIRGRIVDPEGNGVAGVAVRIAEVRGTVDGTMTGWDKVIKSSHPDLIAIQSIFSRALLGPQVPSLFGETETDATGRFTIHGIGASRIARLTIQGGGIVAESFYVRTSEGELITLPLQAEHNEMTMVRRFYGSQFTLVADRTIPVVGRVTDELGQALNGVVITSSEFVLPDMQGAQIRYIRTGSDEVIAVTDDNGQYRLEGLPIAEGNPIYLHGPEDSDIIPSQHSVDTSKAQPAIQPDRTMQVSKDFTLQRGRIVEGRVTNSTTGKGVAGTLRVFQPGPDPNRLQQADGVEWRSATELQSNREGDFRLVLPRRATLLTFAALENRKYKLTPLKSSDEADQPQAVEVNAGAVGLWAVRSERFHAIRPINADVNEPLRVDMTVDPASVTVGNAIAPSGERSSDIFVSWSPPMYPRWDYRTDGRIELYGLDRTEVYRVSVIDLTQRLAGARIVRAGEDGFAVELQPWATVKGRIIDNNGEPLSFVTISSVPIPGDQPDDKQVYVAPLPPTDSARSGRFFTDDQGRYEIAGLVPGNAYQLTFSTHTPDFRQRRTGSLGAAFTLRPGESRDLGDCVVKKNP